MGVVLWYKILSMPLDQTAIIRQIDDVLAKSNLRSPHKSAWRQFFLLSNWKVSMLWAIQISFGERQDPSEISRSHRIWDTTPPKSSFIVSGPAFTHDFNISVCGDHCTCVPVLREII